MRTGDRLSVLIHTKQEKENMECEEWRKDDPRHMSSEEDSKFWELLDCLDKLDSILKESPPEEYMKSFIGRP